MIKFKCVNVLVMGLVLLNSNISFASGGQHEGHEVHRQALSNVQFSVMSEQYIVPDVQLLDEYGNTVKLRELLAGDKSIALNFIFTTCTTICPVMTAIFAQMREELGEKSALMQFVSITIDPEFDRPQVLKEYKEQFDTGTQWTFLTGEGADVETVLRSFDTFMGSKMNHRPVTFLKHFSRSNWLRIDGLANGSDLAKVVEDRLPN